MQTPAPPDTTDVTTAPVPVVDAATLEAKEIEVAPALDVPSRTDSDISGRCVISSHRDDYSFPTQDYSSHNRPRTEGQLSVNVKSGVCIISAGNTDDSALNRDSPGQRYLTCTAGGRSQRDRSSRTDKNGIIARATV